MNKDRIRISQMLCLQHKQLLEHGIGLHQPGMVSNICIDRMRRDNHCKMGGTKVKPPIFIPETIMQL